MFEYVNNISIPDFNIIQAARKSCSEDHLSRFERYFLFRCNDDLRDYLKKEFPKTFSFGVQKILNGQKIHIDHKRNTVYNFIIETGGSDVTTCFWSDLQGSELLKEVKIEPMRWHKLNVTIPHSVKNITAERIAITVWV